MSNKLIAWENLKKRGWQGLSWSGLCHSEEETSSHMFAFCSYPETVWKSANKKLKSQEPYARTSLEQKSCAWWSYSSVHLFSAFPSSFTYRIWWACNTTIFNNRFIPHELTTTLVVQWIREHKSKEKELKIRKMVPPVINKEIPWAYFDGASQGNPPLGGLRGVLYLSKKY